MDVRDRMPVTPDVAAEVLGQGRDRPTRAERLTRAAWMLDVWALLVAFDLATLAILGRLPASSEPVAWLPVVAAGLIVLVAKVSLRGSGRRLPLEGLSHLLAPHPVGRVLLGGISLALWLGLVILATAAPS